MSGDQKVFRLDVQVQDSSGYDVNVGKVPVKHWKRLPRDSGPTQGIDYCHSEAKGKRHDIDNYDGSNDGGGRGDQKRRLDCMEVDICGFQADNYVAGSTAWTLSDQ